ncbi:hypothetical protein SSZBM1_19 [Synechococcus phage S-SZBM1]|uniref:Uncharacterized protein n=1 Tax=Synechococcus phage S-SZBM1 TaxID=2926475 RepID=A0AC61TSD1_9CAUD|nr:hypothetical protein PP650_gp019 [Synechococcus phage S-SZBM1]UNH61136.1 hypothetical protein SSZBM1_19 [Synechococcus phage S-SZBM1]
MNKETTLHMALLQLDSLEKLADKLDNTNYLQGKINKMRLECRRQLMNLTAEVICDV